MVARSDQSTADVRVEVHDDGVLVATLNRPERLNAVRAQTLVELDELLDRVAGDAAIRAVVLTGSGRAFCSGQDLTEVDPGGDRAQLRAELERTQSLARRMVESRVPLIAAVNGVAVGLGAELALGCDIRIASSTARIGFVEAARALFVTNGATWLLPRIVGHAAAAELLLVAEPIDAEQARARGLVTQVTEPDALLDSALETARGIAANAPLSVHALRLALRRGWESSLEQMLDHEIEVSLRLEDADDLAESVRAFAERRPPRYRGR